MTQATPSVPADRLHLLDGSQERPAWLSAISSRAPGGASLHENLFCALAELSCCDDASFCARYTVFVGKVEQVFRGEEIWMDDLELPTLAIHQEQHARVLGALHHVHAQVMAGNLDVGRQAVELLPQWLMLHISTMDTPALAVHLADKEGDFSPQPS